MAYDVEHSGGDDLLVLEFPVHQNHLHELQEVGHAAEHTGTTDGEQLLQHPGAFVVDFALDFAVPEFAELRGRNFRFRDACERIVAGTCHSERSKESFVTLFLQVLARQPLQQNAEQHAGGVAVVENGSRCRIELVSVKFVQNPLGRKCRERFHRDAVIQTVGKQVRNANVVAVVCLEFRNKVDDLRVNRELAFKNVCKRQCRGRADLRQRSDIENGVFGGVQRDGMA